jgi:DNA modification methylase
MSTIAEVLANTHAWHVEQGDSLSVLRTLPDDCVHCCICSPPYAGLRSYLDKDDPAKSLELGLEPLHDCLGWANGTACGQCYVCHLVAVFREVRRVLHPSGTLFLVLGDSYSAAGGPNGSAKQPHREQQRQKSQSPAVGVKGKNLLGVPWRTALALQADGWYLRSAITWAKLTPLCESVRDRPTKATEQIFLLAKSATYFYDQEAERVPSQPRPPREFGTKEAIAARYGSQSGNMVPGVTWSSDAGRNLWDYWEIPDGPLSDFWKLGPEPSKLKQHYALFPSEIPRRCIRLGTSEKGCCPYCLAPWRRVVQKHRCPRKNTFGKKDTTALDHGQAGSVFQEVVSVRTVGWEPCCDCPPHETIPCLILDCFSGLATTGLAARRLGRRYLGIELNAKDVLASERRIRQDCPLFHDVE